MVRAAVEHNFVPQGGTPAKLWYAESMFRGGVLSRVRQFHQVGVSGLEPLIQLPMRVHHHVDEDFTSRWVSRQLI